MHRAHVGKITRLQASKDPGSRDSKEQRPPSGMSPGWSGKSKCRTHQSMLCLLSPDPTSLTCSRNILFVNSK